MTMVNTTNRAKQYDLEERTYQFAKQVALYVKTIPRNISNIEYGSQVIRSSGSVGANYIEANESLSKKDFALRSKICRKEAKESAYWLRLIIETNGRQLFSEWPEIDAGDNGAEEKILGHPREVSIALVFGYWSLELV